jgi:hypothetical protein
MVSVALAGEDALANLSIERTEGGNITGHVRIRSKTQGIALSLGDRITMGECVTVWAVVRVWFIIVVYVLASSAKRQYQAASVVFGAV